MRMLPALAAAIFISGCQTDPVVRDADLRILDKNVLGGTYVVCASKIDWDGVRFTIESLSGDIDKRTFTLGRLDFNKQQIRELNTMALGVDRLFEQMCQSTIALRGQPAALASYVVQRDQTALELFQLLAEMEQANSPDAKPQDVVDEQKKLFRATTGGAAS